MKILFIVTRPLELNTSASLRNINTINGLASAGHVVDVLTSEYSTEHSNYVEISMEHNVNIKYLKPTNIKKLASLTYNINWLKKIRGMLYKKMNQISIYDNYKSLANKVGSLDFRNQKYNLIISSSDPKSSHLFTSELILKEKIAKAPWIQIWGDPFVNDITRNQNQNKEEIILEERRLLSQATSVIYLSQLTLLEQQKNYSDFKNKMNFIPRPYEKEIIYPSRVLEKNQKLSVSYCGDYNTNVRNLKPLYDAIVSTGDKLTVCGYSDRPLNGTENISVNTRMPFSEILKIEKDSDVLVHLSNLKGTQIPGKIYQYSASNKPILFILDGEIDSIKKEFQKYNRYIFCENNTESIKKAIAKIKDLNNMPNTVPIDAFSKEVVIKKILSTVDVNA